MSKRIMCNVFDVILKNKKTKAVIAKDTLLDAGIEISTESNEVFGGKGNKKIAVLSSKREINVKLTDPVWDFRTLAMQLGQEITTGAGIGHAMPKKYTVGATKKVTLDRTPLNNESIYVEKDGKKLTVTSSAKDVTITGEVVEGDEVTVVTYDFATPATSQTIEIDPKKFAQNFEMYLVTFESNVDGSQAEYVEIQLPDVVPTGNFSINTQSAAEASNTEIEFKVLDGSNNLTGKIHRYPIESVT